MMTGQRQQQDRFAMACAMKVRPKCNSGQTSARSSVQDFRPVFADTFLSSWIDDQLGASENRPLLLLHISWSKIDELSSDIPDAAVAVAVAAISSQGGYAFRPRGNQVIGVWGLKQCDPADTERAISAARLISDSIPRPNGARCLLHANWSRLDEFLYFCWSVGCIDYSKQVFAQERRLSGQLDAKTQCHFSSWQPVAPFQGQPPQL